MKCESAVDLVVDSLLDSLDTDQKAELAEHLDNCASCAAEAERVESLWSDLGDLDAPPVGPQAGIRFGRLASRQRRGTHILLQLAAVLALLLVGGAGGYWLRGGTATDLLAPAATDSYLLLVRGFDHGVQPEESDLTGEYVAWAQGLAGQGRLVDANKLTDEPGRWISGTGGDIRTESDVSGYFLINAASYDEAVETARGSPHIRYGGTFEIRQVDRAN